MKSEMRVLHFYLVGQKCTHATYTLFYPNFCNEITQEQCFFNVCIILLNPSNVEPSQYETYSQLQCRTNIVFVWQNFMGNQA